MRIGDHISEAAFAHQIGDALFAETIAELRSVKGENLLVGLSGAQGSGKSTRAAELVARLQRRGLSVALLSLDDFYLTAMERGVLAGDIHPLFGVRGVPGTHDVALLTATIDCLLSASDSSRTQFPYFDKLQDDRLPIENWKGHSGRADVVLLEGWCIGARPQPIEALETAINELERSEDSDRKWRSYVNMCLSTDYARLFANLDLRLMFRAPDFSRVVEWKVEQEENLSRNAGHHSPPKDAIAMARFVSHYERLTRWMLDDEPADLIADLDSHRIPIAWRRRVDMAQDGDTKMISDIAKHCRKSNPFQ